MKTHELAKELRALAQKLDALAYEASETVACALELSRRSGLPQRRKNKFDPAPLTVGAIAAAVEAATRRPTTSVELRQDVYERRCKKLSLEYAEGFHTQVKTGTPAPVGERFGLYFYTAVPGLRSISEATPKYGKTPINAAADAWSRAVRYVLGRIVPAYNYHELRNYAERVSAGTLGGSAWRLEEKISGNVDRWLNANAVLICEVDAAGQVIRIHGLDPAPFVELHKAVLAGNPDPLGVLKTA